MVSDQTLSILNQTMLKLVASIEGLSNLVSETQEAAQRGYQTAIDDSVERAIARRFGGQG